MRIIKIIALVLAGLLLAALVGGWVFRTPLLRLAAGLVLPRLEKQSGVAVRFTDLHVSALGRIEVKGLRVSIKGHRLFAARGLAFGVDLWALFDRRIRLTRVRVQGPVVDLRGLPPGRAPSAPESGRPWTLEVAGLDLTAGRIMSLPALVEGPVRAVDRLNVRGRLEMALGGPGMALQVRFDSLSAVIRPQGLVVKRLAGRLSITDQGLTVHALSLATAGSSLALSGTLTGWAAPRLKVQVSRGKIDPNEVARFAPGLPAWFRRAAISGGLTVSGTRSGLRFSVRAKRREMILSARGRVDLTRFDRPAYDLNVTIKNLPARRLAAEFVAFKMPVPLPERTTLALKVAGRGVRPERLEAAGSLVVGGDWLRIDGRWRRGSFQARVRANDLPAADLVARYLPARWRPLIPAPKRARVVVVASGKWQDRRTFQVQGRLRIGEDWLLATARLGPGSIQITDLRLNWGWLALQGKAGLDAGRRLTAAFSGRLERLPAGKPGEAPLGLATLAGLRWQGPVLFQGKLHGDLKRPRIQLTAYLPGATWRDVDVKGLRLEVSGRPPAWGGAAPWEAWPPAGIDFQVRAARVRAGGVIVSTLQTSGLIRGWLRPGAPPLMGVSLSARAGEVVAGPARLRQVDLKTMAAGRPSLEGLIASVSARVAGYRLGDETGHNLVARGEWRAGEGQVNLTARARRWGGLAAAARFRLIDGGRVALRLVRLAGLGLRSVGQSRLVIGPGRVDLDRLRLVGRGGQITLRQVRWSPDVLSGDLSAVVSLGRWTSLLGLGAGLRGRLTLKARWRGSAANPVVRATAGLRSFGFKRLVIRAADIKLDYAGRRARLKLVVRSAGARLEMAGQVPLNLALTGSGRPGLVDGPVRLRATGSLPDLGRLGLKYAGLRRLSGRGRLSLKVSGTMNRPLVDGRLKLSRVAFRYQSRQGGFRGLDRFQVKASADLSLSYRSGRLAVRGRLSSGQVARAEGSWQQAGELSLADFQWRPAGRPEWRVTAAVPDLAKLDLDLPGIIGLKGGIKATLTAGRAAGGRRLTGQIALKNVSFRSIPQGMDLQRLSGRVRFTGERIVIDHLAGRSGRGRITLSGEVAMAGVVPRAFRLKFTARRALVRSTNVRVEMDADLKLGGTWTKPRVDGRVAIKGARLGAGPEYEAGGGDVIVVEDVTSRRDLNRSLAVGPGGDLAKRLAINVRVDIPDGTPVKGLGVNVQTGGRIEVRKAAGEDLRIRGAVQVQQGFFILQGNKFYINQGRVVFAGLKKPNPSLNLTFEQRGRGFSYILHVRGTAESPRFELRREPPVPPGQLAQVLSTGKTSGGRDGVADVGSMAGAMIGNVVLQDFTRLVRLPLAPDQVRVVTDEFSGAPGVEVGKYFGNSLYVTVGSGVDTLAGGRVRAEYRLNRNWSVEGQLGSGGRSGVDLFYDVEF